MFIYKIIMNNLQNEFPLYFKKNEIVEYKEKSLK